MMDAAISSTAMTANTSRNHRGRSGGGTRGSCGSAVVTPGLPAQVDDGDVVGEPAVLAGAVLGPLDDGVARSPRPAAAASSSAMTTRPSSPSRSLPGPVRPSNSPSVNSTRLAPWQRQLRCSQLRPGTSAERGAALPRPARPGPRCAAAGPGARPAAPGPSGGPACTPRCVRWRRCGRPRARRRASAPPADCLVRGSSRPGPGSARPPAGRRRAPPRPRRARRRHR